MTYPSQHQPPYVPGSVPPNGDWKPPAPEQKSRTLPWLLAILGVSVLAVVGLITALAVAPDAPSVGAATTIQPDTAPAGAAPVTAEAPQAVRTPAIGDFELTAKVTNKQCFGSAGCNVEFEPSLAYGGPPLDEDVTWRLIYEARGVEDGPLVGTIEVTGEDYRTDAEFVGTRSTKSKITLKVVSIERF